MKFSKVFEKFNDAKAKGLIKEFWISMTSLDEMFMKMAETAPKTNTIDDIVL